MLYNQDDEAANFNLTEIVMKHTSHYEDLQMYADFCNVACECTY